jgi:squalene/oxidosqualene cyclase-like protein
MNHFWKYWTLKAEPKGRQRWEFADPGVQWDTEKGKQFLRDMQKSFAFDKKVNPNSADLVYREKQRQSSQTTANAAVESQSALQKGIAFYQSLQSEGGYWPGDYGGPHFLMPGMVIASYITESPLPMPHQALIKQYFLNHQNEDGGWGLHIEDNSTMFGTVLQYVVLRLLGMKAHEPEMAKAKEWILKNGGASGIPSWGKFYLAVLGVYEWEGCNSLFPEMWLLPESLSFHPSRYWCHARMVYLPMSYCYGLKIKGRSTPLIEEIRQEIYTEAYDKINWQQARDHCAATDLYHQPSSLLKRVNAFTNLYETIRIPALRRKATGFILDYINAEDEQTNYIDIGPVNQVINSICVWHGYGKESEAFKKHYDRWFDYLWVAEDGMKMNGYNGSQFWDTAFAIQALMESSGPDVQNTLAKAYRYLDESQVKTEVNDSAKFYRHPSVGGWPFSNVEHGWPITDCTAEGLKVALKISRAKAESTETLIPENRLEAACDLILSMQNEDGGWASYELTRGPKSLERLNPSEIFGNIMIDYSYTECTSACVQALAEFKNHFPGYRQAEIEEAIRKGIAFIFWQQNKDGSWYGSWAVCFTYGIWFAVETLTRTDLPDVYHPLQALTAAEKACNFLLERQNADGGWGEKFESCLRKEYVPHEKSQVVNTSWALLSLMAFNHPNKEAIDKGIQFLVSRQLETGDFPQEGISGVFNHSCGISYTSYRNVFPIWALARYEAKYKS